MLEQSGASMEEMGIKDEPKKERNASDALTLMVKENDAFKQKSSLMDNKDYQSESGFWGAKVIKNEQGELILWVDESANSALDRMGDPIVRNFDEHRQRYPLVKYYKFFQRHPELLGKYTEATGEYGAIRDELLSGKSSRDRMVLKVMRAFAGKADSKLRVVAEGVKGLLGQDELSKEVKAVVDERLAHWEQENRQVASENSAERAGRRAQMRTQLEETEWKKVYEIALPGGKHYRDYAATAERIKDLELEDFYQVHQDEQGNLAGFKFSDPEFFSKSMFLSDIINMDRLKMKTDDLARQEKLRSFFDDGEAYAKIVSRVGDYIGAVHHQGKAFGELPSGYILFTGDDPDAPDSRPIYTVPDVNFNPDKNIPLGEKQAMDLGQYLLNWMATELARRSRDAGIGWKKGQVLPENILEQARQSLRVWLEGYVGIDREELKDVLQRTLRHRRANRLGAPFSKDELERRREVNLKADHSEVVRSDEATQVNPLVRWMESLHNKARSGFADVAILGSKYDGVVRQAADLVEQTVEDFLRE